MGRNHSDFTNARDGASNPKNWENEDDKNLATHIKLTEDFEAPDWADHYQEKHT